MFAALINLLACDESVLAPSQGDERNSNSIFDVTDNTNTSDPEDPEDPEDSGYADDTDDDLPTESRFSGTYSLATEYDEKYEGTSSNMLGGISVDSVDYDGDGFDDILYGAPVSDLVTGGYAFLRQGGSTGLASTSTRVSGVYAGDLAGYSVAGVGDVDGDDYEDFVVGAIGEETNGAFAGAAYLVSGANVTESKTLDALFPSIMFGDKAEYYAGIEVAGGGGDVDADGIPDILVGAFGREASGVQSRGAAYLLYGGSDLSNIKLDRGSSVRIDGSGSADTTGKGLSIGNVNGDDYDDVLVGSYNANSYRGRADVFYGPLTAKTMDTNDSDVRVDGDPVYGYALGFAGTLAGDVDGVVDEDGNKFQDIVVCDYGESSVGAENGACYLFLGGSMLSDTFTAGIDEDTKWTGPEAGARFGISVAIGDFDGDGIDDVLIGSNGGRLLYGSTYIGGAYLYYGPITKRRLTAADADAFFEGENQGDYAGSAVGKGDFNGDGRDDVTIGAPYYDYTDSITDSGALYVRYGL